MAAQLQCDQIYRIASTRDGKSVLNNNYALNTLPAPNGNDAQKGIDVTAERVKQEVFYSEDLKWNFDDGSWKWIDGLYPVLAWQKEVETTTSLIYLSQSIPVLSLRKGSSIDLSQYYASGHGGILSYSCANSKVKLDGSIISVTEDVEITDLETVTVSVSVSGFKAAGD
ncbi:hypothetical protein NXX53_05105 [Bacteroides salyersiae]|nr:hypothetical protein [Bacteroides salyersiae]